MSASYPKSVDKKCVPPIQDADLLLRAISIDTSVQFSQKWHSEDDLHEFRYGPHEIVSVNVPIAAKSTSLPLVNERKAGREVGHFGLPFGRVPISRRGKTLESMSCKRSLINHILSFLRRALWDIGCFNSRQKQPVRDSIE